eukprot:15204325-Alexandrium_andersonii.AAC.1
MSAPARALHLAWLDPNGGDYTKSAIMSIPARARHRAWHAQMREQTAVAAAVALRAVADVAKALLGWCAPRESTCTRTCAGN